jgi:hypothetical protein
LPQSIEINQEEESYPINLCKIGKKQKQTKHAEPLTKMTYPPRHPVKLPQKHNNYNLDTCSKQQSQP